MRPAEVRVGLCPKLSGGWLGFQNRRRSWQAAISPGEAHAALEPGIAECDLAPARAFAPKGAKGNPLK